MAYKYKSYLTEQDFTVKETALTTTFKDVYEYRIPAGQKVVIGAGKVIGGVDDREQFYISLSDGTNVIGNYKVRIIKRDANNIVNIQLYSNIDGDGDGIISDNIGEGGATGLEKITPDKVINEDQFIVVQIALNSGTATLSDTASSIRLPITIKALR